MASRDEELRKAYKTLSAKDIIDELLETNVTPLHDFDGRSMMSLFQYEYKMSNLVEPVMVVVKKGTEREKMTPQIYKNLVALKTHQVLVPIRNYYDKGNGMLVLGTVNGSLGKWLDLNGGDFMFEGTGIERRFSPTFRSLIIDLWGVFDKMSKKKIYPMGVTFDDFYVKTMAIGPPRILMLLTQFKELGERNFFYTSEWRDIWTCIDTVIAKICEKSG